MEEGEERGREPTSLGQSVAVVTVNDATSNAVGIFSASLSFSLSPCSLSLSSFPLTADSSLPPRFALRRFTSPHSFRDPRSSGGSTGCLKN